MKYSNIIFTFLVIIISSTGIFAQEVNIVLKNGKVIVGQVVEEKPDYILLDNEIGQLKITRQNIQSISYNPFVNLPQNGNKNEIDSVKGYKFLLKDPVVVYLKSGNVISGLLLAKSLNMVMLQTESGNLTIQKQDLLKIEYISSEYAERGEIVTAYLNNGQTFEGNIYFEDSKELTLDTQIGRLTLPKNKLRTLEYTGEIGLGKKTIVDQFENLAINKRSILPRYDVIYAGYTSDFGPNYGSGFGLGYNSRYSISQFEGLNLSGLGGLSLNYFSLNKENVATENQSLNATLKGGAFIASIIGGAQVNIYPQDASFYDFCIAPTLEGHIIYRSLEQSYPSYPQLNSTENKTEFKIGVGIKFGMEFLFDTYRLGLGYNIHQIFGTDGYNQFSITLVKPLF